MNPFSLKAALLLAGLTKSIPQEMRNGLSPDAALLLIDYMAKIEQINESAEYPIIVRYLGKKRLEVWARDADLSQKSVTAGMALYGGEFLLKVMYGGTCDRPKRLFDQLIPGRR